MESVASQNPEELNILLEQISGSDEQFEDEKARAEDKSALIYQKKKTTIMERKQKKEQREEAEKHLRLQDQLILFFFNKRKYKTTSLDSIFSFKFQPGVTNL